MRSKILMLVLLLLIPAVSLGNSIGVSFTGITIEQPPSGIVTLAASDLSALSSVLPTFYRSGPIDISPSGQNWDVVDMENTTEISTATGGDCTTVVTPDDAGDDDGIAINCVWENVPSGTLLDFPAGVFHMTANHFIDSVLAFNGGTSGQGIRGVGMGTRHAPLTADPATIFRMMTTITAGNGNRSMFVGDVNGFSGTDDVIASLGTPTTWTAGFTTGTQILTVASVSGLSDGVWVLLKADDAPEDGIQTAQLYRAMVTCVEGTGSECSGGVGSLQIKIDRGLPTTSYWSTNPTVTLWRPSNNMYFEGFAIEFDDAIDTLPIATGLRLENVGNMEIKNVQVVDARQHLVEVIKSARVFWHASMFSRVYWGQSFDVELMQVNESSDITLEDNFWSDSSQSITNGDGSIGLIVAYNHFHSITPNGSYVPPGSTSDGAPRADDCHISIFVHTSTGSDALFERNTHYCPMGWDANRGAGHSQIFFGNRGMNSDGVTSYFDGSFDMIGGFAVNLQDYDSGTPTPDAYTALNWIIANNITRKLGDSHGYNGYGEGVQLLDNVARTSCRYDQGDNVQQADGGACAQQIPHATDLYGPDEFPLGDPNRDYPIGDVYSNNSIGVNFRGNSRIMPSSLYLTADPGFLGGTGTFPYVGADLDNYTSGEPSHCLPAAERVLGSCP